MRDVLLLVLQSLRMCSGGPGPLTAIPSVLNPIKLYFNSDFFIASYSYLYNLILTNCAQTSQDLHVL